jgi:hypothetical protein
MELHGIKPEEIVEVSRVVNVPRSGNNVRIIFVIEFFH